jgi:hypothetical protein
MAESDLSKLSLENLEKQHRILKQSTSVLGGLIIIMALAGGYLTFKQGFSIFTVLPIFFLAMIPINLKKIKNIKAEIASRL